MNEAPIAKTEQITQKGTSNFEYKLFLDKKQYKIHINLIEEKIEFICFEEDNNKFQYHNIYTKNQFQQLHKYFLGGDIDEIYDGIIDFISNSKKKKKNNEVILIIPIRYFGKTSEISLELIKKNRESLPIQNRIQFLENTIEKLIEENKILKERIIKLENKINQKIVTYKEIKSLKINSGICSVILLKNGNIAIGTRNGELIIYNPINLEEIIKVKAHSQGNTSIYSLLELSDNTILTCGGNLTMKHYKWNINEKKLEEIQELYCRNDSSYICRVIELSNKNLVSSDNNHILFWAKSSNNKYEIIKDIADFQGVIQHLFLMNEKYVIAHNNNGILRIYNHENDYNLEKQINNICSYAYMHRFSKINNDLFCLGGDEFIYIFSISKMELVSSFKLANMKFYSILTLSNNTILGGTNNHFIQFKINEKNKIKEISRKENVHNTKIWQMAILNNNDEGEKIISVSDDYYIKIWELNYFFS